MGGLEFARLLEGLPRYGILILGMTTFDIWRVCRSVELHAAGDWRRLVKIRNCGFPALLLIGWLWLMPHAGMAGRTEEPTFAPLRIDNAVLAHANKGYLSDPRVFNAEFYRKLYPQLKLADDDAA